MAAKTVAGSFAFPRTHRVTRGADIEQVRREGKRVRTASMEVRAVASLAVSASHAANAPASAAVAVARVGVVVPKYGKGSVDRNTLKRRLKELVRIEVLPVLPALDVVIRTSPRAYTRTFDELREEVRKWTHQLVTGRASR